MEIINQDLYISPKITILNSKKVIWVIHVETKSENYASSNSSSNQCWTLRKGDLKKYIYIIGLRD